MAFSGPVPEKLDLDGTTYFLDTYSQNALRLGSSVVIAQKNHELIHLGECDSGKIHCDNISKKVESIFGPKFSHFLYEFESNEDFDYLRMIFYDFELQKIGSWIFIGPEKNTLMESIEVMYSDNFDSSKKGDVMSIKKIHDMWLHQFKYQKFLLLEGANVDETSS